MSILEKASYLKGLADGQGLTDETREGRMTLAIIDAIDELAREIMSLNEASRGFNDEISGLSDSLEMLEEIVFGDESDDDDDCDCGDCGDDDEMEYETACPKCGEDIIIDEEDLIAGSVTCPKCGGTWEFEFADFGGDDDDEEDEDE